MEDQFFLVWNPDGHSPQHKHSTLGLAKTEAERLARFNPGQTFIVLASVGECTKQDVDWKQHGDGIPF